MLSIREAQNRICNAAQPLPSETLRLADCAERFLSHSIHAQLNAPPFDASAMDGYAVHSHAVTTVPTTLPLAGESRAGGVPPAPLPAGHAMRIFTGAPMPEGADAVVVQEDSKPADANSIQLNFAPAPGHHVRAKGNDVRQGDLLLSSGTLLHPGAIGLLASQGIGEVPVHRSPTIAILSTGSELRDLDEPARPGSIISSNDIMLEAMCRRAGFTARRLPRVGDTLNELRDAVRQGLRSDLLLTTGGVSVGDYDLVGKAFEAEGVVIDFWKVRIKPGKPVLFGTAGGTLALGLPGNPVSAFVTFAVFGIPALARLAGNPAPIPGAIEVLLAEPARHRTGRPELVRAKLRRENGHLWAIPADRQGSAALSSLATADALLCFEADREHYEAGEKLRALVLNPCGMAEPWL